MPIISDCLGLKIKEMLVQEKNSGVETSLLPGGRDTWCRCWRIGITAFDVLRLRDMGAQQRST